MKKLYKRIVTMGMIGISAILAWIYCMYEYSDKPVYIAVASVIVVGAMFVFLNSLLDLHLSKQDDMKNFLSSTVNDSLSRLAVSNDESERIAKASYVQIRKQSQLLKEISTFEKDGFAAMADINAQAVDSINNTINKSTKVIVKYNTTNTDKIIESFGNVQEDIDRLINHVDSFLANFSQFASDYAATNVEEKEHDVEMKNNIIDSIEEFKQELKYFSNQLLTNGIPGKLTAGVATPVENVLEDNDASLEASEEISVAETNDVATEDISSEELSNTEEINDTTDVTVENESVPEVVDSPDGLLTADMLSGLFDEEPAAEEPVAEEPVAVAPVDDDPNKQLSPDEIAALFAAAAPAEEPVVEEPAAEEPVAVAPIDDDPNKQLSPDEIAALFAAAAPAEEPVAEEPDTEEPVVEEPAAEEAAPDLGSFFDEFVDKDFDDSADMADVIPFPRQEEESKETTFDPNRQLTPDEIATLFAASSQAEEDNAKVENAPDPIPMKQPEPVAVAPVDDDPNKQLSPDEIAALFAAASAPAEEPKVEEPAPEPVAVTPVSDDPNKQLSPDEIAALFASAGM